MTQPCKGSSRSGLSSFQASLSNAGSFRTQDGRLKMAYDETQDVEGPVKAGTCPVCRFTYAVDKYGILEKHDSRERGTPQHYRGVVDFLWMCREKDLMAFELQRSVVAVSRLDHPKNASAAPPMSFQEKVERAFTKRLKQDECDAVQVFGFWQETMVGRYSSVRVLTHIDYQNSEGKRMVKTYERGLDHLLREIFISDRR